MIENGKITNEEMDSPTTGDDSPVVDEKTTNEIPQEVETKQTSETSGDVPVWNLTPTEKAQKTHYEKEAVKNESKAKLFNTLTTCVKVLSIVIGIVLTLSGIYLAYFISSVAEPIGSLKKSVENIEDVNDEFKESIKKLEDELQETREEFIRNSVKL